jgi:hypothetical protein
VDEESKKTKVEEKTRNAEPGAFSNQLFPDTINSTTVTEAAGKITGSLTERSFSFGIKGSFAALNISNSGSVDNSNTLPDWIDILLTFRLVLTGLSLLIFTT